jgi:D-alanine-D-alanine ligase-like ATP-grasp enzyme
MTANATDTILVIGSGSERTRGPLLADLAAVVRVVLLQVGPIDWQRAWVADAESAPNPTMDAVYDAATRLLARQRVDAYLCYDEALLLAAAQVADQLGVPGLPVAAAEIGRDKLRQREVLGRLGVSSTTSVPVDSDDLAAGLAAAEQIGYPVVVKPRGLSGSAGVSRVDDPTQFMKLFELAREIDPKGMHSPGLLIEEYLSGQEFSVDCWALDGVAEPVVLARKATGYEPHAIEINHLLGVGAADEETVESVCALACQAALACQVDRTIAHVEIKVTDRGPRVIEVNVRPGGEMIPQLAVRLGVPYASVLADVVQGRRPAPIVTPTGAVGIDFLYPPRAQTFPGLADAPELRAMPWLAQVVEIANRGAEVAPPPMDFWGRIGWVVATGANADQIAARFEIARKTLLAPLAREDTRDDQSAAEPRV